MAERTSTSHNGKVRLTRSSARIIALVVALAVIEPTRLRIAAAIDKPPEGTILFSSLTPRGWNTYLADTTAEQSRHITEDPALDYNAAFSPVGERIIFVVERDGNLELYVAGRNDRGLMRLTHDFALDDHPSFSPDGNQIAFCSTRDPAGKLGKADNVIFVMNSNGTTPRVGIRRLPRQLVAGFALSH